MFREEAVRGGEDPPAADDAASAHRARPLAVQAALPVAHLHAKWNGIMTAPHNLTERPAHPLMLTKY